MYFKKNIIGHISYNYFIMYKQFIFNLFEIIETAICLNDINFVAYDIVQYKCFVMLKNVFDK